MAGTDFNGLSLQGLSWSIDGESEMSKTQGKAHKLNACIALTRDESPWLTPLCHTRGPLVETVR